MILVGKQEVIRMARKKSILTILKEEVMADMISKTKSGTYMFRKGYFYRHGDTAEGFAVRVESDLKRLGFITTLIDVGDHYADFKGGAGVKANSHFYVEFDLKEPS
jgi:hypothetical protein